jgi:hypothetical protein
MQQGAALNFFFQFFLMLSINSEFLAEAKGGHHIRENGGWSQPTIVVTIHESGLDKVSPVVDCL